MYELVVQPQYRTHFGIKYVDKGAEPLNYYFLKCDDWFGNALDQMSHYLSFYSQDFMVIHAHALKGINAFDLNDFSSNYAFRPRTLVSFEETDTLTW